MEGSQYSYLQLHIWRAKPATLCSRFVATPQNQSFLSVKGLPPWLQGSLHIFSLTSAVIPRLFLSLLIWVGGSGRTEHAVVEVILHGANLCVVLIDTGKAKDLHLLLEAMDAVQFLPNKGVTQSTQDLHRRQVKSLSSKFCPLLLQ